MILAFFEALIIIIMRRSVPPVTCPCHSQSVDIAVKIGSVYLLKLVITKKTHEVIEYYQK